MKRCALTLLLAVGLWGQTENLCCGRTRWRRSVPAGCCWEPPRKG